MAAATEIEMATNKAIITAAQLEAARACNEQVQLFRKLFGDSVNVTVARARKVADQFDWNFAQQFLDEEGQSEYKRVSGPAWSEYKRVSGAAWSEYERVSGAAWASAYIATSKRKSAA